MRINRSAATYKISIFYLACCAPFLPTACLALRRDVTPNACVGYESLVIKLATVILPFHNYRTLWCPGGFFFSPVAKDFICD